MVNPDRFLFSLQVQTKIKMLEYKLKEEYIELIKLLKLTRIAATGGHAKILVEEGRVQLNGKTEYRKRAKLRADDTVSCEGQEVKIV